MSRTLTLFGKEIVTFPVCYGLPTIFGLAVSVTLWLVLWSYHQVPVRYTSVTVEQIGLRGDYITLKITKFVTWNRLCPGVAEQEIRPVIAADNPAKVSSAAIKLDSHVINTPKHLGSNDQKGDPTPIRFIVIPSGQLVAGNWRYKITAKMACFPWEYLWPIRSDSYEADFAVQ